MYPISLWLWETYASVARRPVSGVRVSRGATVDISASTSFFIVPDSKNAGKYESSWSIEQTVCKILKSSECALRINRISWARDNGIRIEADNPDIKKIVNDPKLAKTGLKVIENLKTNLRLILFGIPIGMTSTDIKKELIAQNFQEDQFTEADLKIIYMYPVKTDKVTTNCVIEVSPSTRKVLSDRGYIYLR